MPVSKSLFADAWAFHVQDALPVAPVPLKTPDKEVVLDLGKALKMICRRGLYHLSIDYHEDPPPPPFGEDARNWMKQLLEEKNRKTEK
ncbi:MAG: DUF4058 family protein [Phaeodactylibacter sp.]|nr:DUF4058 family protein [Phaeodactylibacter sp.]